MSIQLFYSKPAKAMIYLAIPVILVTQYGKFSSLNIITQALVYMAIAYNAECLVEGGCDLWAWGSVALPIIYSLLFIFFGHQLGLVARPPSPITNIIPIKRVPKPDKPTPTPANTTIAGNEPQSGSAQPTQTTGDIAEAFSF